MLDINLIEKITQDDRDVYKATEKGLDFLQRYREITELLGFESKTPKCPRCQKEVSSNHKFCPYCGKNIGIEIVRVRAK